jgi:D-alanyl-D-alanine carboxypeptidase/D-alanyl-D-alanine-endopeptidase (penicillin-binding protein 4)
MPSSEHFQTAPLAALALLFAAGAGASDLSALNAEARSILGAGQGVYVEDAAGTVLLAQAADRPVHPASVSKVPTTLALLRRLGPDYRFTTAFSGTGPVHDGLLAGDLLVTGGGDPFFVDENALLVAERLYELGVQRISGTLRLQGPLIFNWKGEAAGDRLRAALSGEAPPAAWDPVRALALADGAGSAGASPPVLQFGAGETGVAEAMADAPPARPLLVHRSQPLLSLVKALND